MNVLSPPLRGPVMQMCQGERGAGLYTGGFVLGFLYNAGLWNTTAS